ncbi:hypothetical protein M011DRAFT_486081 [Sporormia fimetaria CBS 119925]|uniref:Uncharacterized protein n=1 Tax=Sporormia fimetaria CBS 119925 TaxID=1340428 RepID=A0A6A6VCB5_9PLEO|nr:hypothetical protein M011DRAFT_486081 [Sporormia fimetaria CBS 119925]
MSSPKSLIVALLTVLGSTRQLPGPPYFRNSTPHDLPHGALAGDLGAQAGDLWNSPPPADDGQWSKAICKGKTLLTGMRSSDLDAGLLLNPPRQSARSEFVDFPNEFHEWNYRQRDALDDNLLFGEFDWFWGIARALRDLGVSQKPTLDGGKNFINKMFHGNLDLAESGTTPLPDQKYLVDGKEYTATGASFLYSINPQDGVLMALSLSSPQHAVASWNPPLPADQLPKLQKSSDVAWGIWKMRAGTNVKNLRYFLALTVINELTNRILIRATGGRVQPWPGVTFTSETEEASALLGTPNSVAIGYLLMQHKEELGNRWVSAVRVFHCDTDHKTPCLLYYITDGQ